MGNGRYAAHLNYEEWYDFNNAQRAHQNFVEWAPSTIVLVLIAGVYFPIISAAIGLAVIVARIIYSIGYLSKGPGGRLIGALVNDLALLALFIISIISGVYLIQGQQINGQLIS